MTLKERDRVCVPMEIEMRSAKYTGDSCAPLLPPKSIASFGASSTVQLRKPRAGSAFASAGGVCSIVGWIQFQVSTSKRWKSRSDVPTRFRPPKRSKLRAPTAVTVWNDRAGGRMDCVSMRCQADAGTEGVLAAGRVAEAVSE